MSIILAPEQVVQQQLAAYNAKDIKAWLATYADDAKQFELPSGMLLASGKAELLKRITLRFAEPDLHARLINRIVMGSTVVDHEEVTRNFPEGPGSMEMLCIYEVGAGKIQTAWFRFGAPRMARAV